jgi:hypothetical protein
MTRGRRREHYQWNMDIVGVPGGCGWVCKRLPVLAAIALVVGKEGGRWLADWLPARFCLSCCARLSLCAAAAACLVCLCLASCFPPPLTQTRTHNSPNTGVEAEAELLSALTTFFSRVGLTPADVGLKVSSRKVLGAVLERYGVPPENFAQVRE